MKTIWTWGLASLATCRCVNVARQSYALAGCWATFRNCPAVIPIET